MNVNLRARNPFFMHVATTFSPVLSLVARITGPHMGFASLLAHNNTVLATAAFTSKEGQFRYGGEADLNLDTGVTSLSAQLMSGSVQLVS